MAVRFHKQISSKEPAVAVEKKKAEFTSEKHGLFKAEECRIEKDSKSTFSGTDNGVVNLFATVPFDQSRFRFHLCINKSEQETYVFVRNAPLIVWRLFSNLRSLV